MTIGELGALGEFAGAILLFASLVYVAIQIRQNSRNIQSQSINSQADQLQKFAALQAIPEVAAALTKMYRSDRPKLDFEDAALIEAYYLSGLSIAQAQYRHNVLGLSSDWDQYERLVASFFATDHVRDWWKGMGCQFFDPDFAAAVDGIIAEEHGGDFWTRYPESGSGAAE